MAVNEHNYKYDPKASDSTKVVTICAHCGDIQIKLTLSNIDQMDLWTKPPSYYLPHPSNILDRVLN